MEPTAAQAMDHVVVVVFENRSFDNLLGQLYTAKQKPGFEGVLDKVLTNPVPEWAKPVPRGNGRQPGMVRYGAAPNGNTPNPDPGEEFQHTNTQLYGILDPDNIGVGAHDMATTNAPGPTAGPPTMDGFVADYISNYRSVRGEDPDYQQYRQIMQGHTPKQVPVLSGIARGFAVFDHWFSEVPSQTFPNRSFWTAASSSGLVVNSPITEWHFHNDAETIFDRLEEHDRTWKVYVLEPSPISITGLVHTPRLKKWFHERFVPFSQFERDAAAGALPDFALIEPNLLSGHADYHPPFGDAIVKDVNVGVDVGSAVDSGEQFLARVYSAVRNAPLEGASNVWNTTLLVGWDEPGGTYDHVPPPDVPPPDGSPGQLEFGFDRSGYRVPAILVSPWVAKGAVVSEEYRHTSMIATLRRVWGLGDSLTQRDGSARTFEGLFSLESPRDPKTWPDVTALAAAANPRPFDPDTSIGGLARTLVHGLVHLGRAHGYREGPGPETFDPHAQEPEVQMSPSVIVDTARAIGGHFFPLLAQPKGSTPAVPSIATGHGIEATPLVQPIRMGLAMKYAYPTLDSVEVSLLFRTRRLWGHLFSRKTAEKRHSLNLGLVRVDLTFTGDLFRGIITWKASVATRSWFGRPWVSRRELAERSVIRFDPSIGEIDGRTDVYPPIVFNPVYGSSQNCTLTILRIHVDDDPRRLCEVGSKVKKVMFPDHPPFVFNAVAAVGAFEEGGPQAYTNPVSPWFNVFLGYYQLDCPKDRWDRPFGFHSAKGIESDPYVEDLVRLGKSDWNFFSNWDYGVPEKYLLPYCPVDSSPDFDDRGIVMVAGGGWRRIELRNVEVASCYESDDPAAARLTEENTPITGVIRSSFGYPSPTPRFTESFIANKLDAVLHLAYFEDEESYHTMIFGGTAHAGADRDLLDAEVAATLTVIADQYAHRGFAPRASREAPAPSRSGKSARADKKARS